MADQSQSFEGILSNPTLLTIWRGRTDKETGKFEVIMRGALVSAEVVVLARVWADHGEGRAAVEARLAQAAGIDLNMEVWGFPMFKLVWL